MSAVWFHAKHSWGEPSKSDPNLIKVQKLFGFQNLNYFDDNIVMWLQAKHISISWFTWYNGGDLKRSSFRLGLSEFSKEKFGSFLLQEVVDWLALHQEWLEEKQSDLWKALLSGAGLDILFCWRNCCQGQGYCCPLDGCTAIANCRLGLLHGTQSFSLKIRFLAECCSLA